jgi:hypothetical protein
VHDLDSLLAHTDCDASVGRNSGKANSAPLLLQKRDERSRIDDVHAYEWKAESVDG